MMKKPKGIGPDEEIPRIFYHGTTEDKAEAILEEGLLPQLSQRDDEETDFIFLAESPKTAKMFAPGGDYWRGGDIKGVILKIQPPMKLILKFRFDLGEFVRSPVEIPPEYIEIFEYTNG